MKKFLCTALCALIAISCLAVPVSAADGPVITVSELTAVPGDAVAISVDISKNPGIMAMTFTVSYDKDAFTFVKYKLGRFNDYTIVNHPDRGYVSFVNCEGGNKKYNGNIFSLIFTVNDTAAPGRHPFNIRNINPEKNGDSLKGCFANWEHTEITPTVINGGVTVGKTCSNSGHTYGEYTVTVKPSCTETGIRSHFCTRCGHVENGDIAPTGHSFEENWTVDRPATAQQQGVMSRHCKNCDAVADKVYFSLDESRDNNINNETDAAVTENDWDKLKEIYKTDEDTDSQKAEHTDATVGTENAAELVKAQKNRYLSVWAYLFGDDAQPGFFGIMIKQLKAALSSVPKYLILLPLILLL